jgi:preprotein translocase subunit SecY
MKILKIILATFIIAFATSALYEFNFIEKNPVRYILVILLIVFELIAGICFAIWKLKEVIKELKSNQK